MHAIPRSAQSATASEPYDLFVSYNRNDCTWARKVLSESKMLGLRVWMDELNLAPGDLWQREITNTLARSHAVAVLIGSSGLGGWQQLEVQMALAQQQERQQRMIPVLLPNADRSLTSLDLLSPFMHCDLRGTDRPAQLAQMAAKLIEVRQEERELLAQYGELMEREGRDSTVDLEARIASAERSAVAELRAFENDDLDEYLRQLESSEEH